MGRRSAVLVLLALVVAPVGVQAQVFRWTDERGQGHYSEGLDSVPERYRATAKPLLLPPRPASPEPGKPAATPSGVTKIPFTPGSAILVSAKINGAGPVTLLLDTGADRTVVAPLPLWRLGISTWFAPRADMRGVTGTTRVDVVQVQSIEVGEAKVGPLTIIAHDAELRNADGLLGRDFLDRFNVTIDSAAGIVTLTPR